MAEPLCPAWLSFSLTNIFRRMAHDPVRILSPFVREGDTVLDVGCGPGFFAVPLARMVGDRGQVVAVDLQPGMLIRTQRRAEKAGVAGRVHVVLAEKTALRLDVQADFALVFWMAHEVGDPDRLFAEIRASLKPRGSVLLVEPLAHVSRRRFRDIVAVAAAAGFDPREAGPIRLSRAVVLRPEAVPRSGKEVGTGS